MTPDSTKKPPDTKVYKAGDTVSATITLEHGHAVPTRVWVYLNLQATPGAPALANRIAYLTLQWDQPAAMTGTPPVAPGSEPTAITVRAEVPKHIVGGVYKATSALFFMPDGSQRQVAEPDPDGDFARQIVDDPPVAFDTPVIKDLD